MLPINDEENLKKENITIECCIKEFNDIIQKGNNVKDKVEKEINEIDRQYNKALSELVKSYEKKHEILIKEENDLKENLQNKVTKVKEKLEKYLSKLNNLIKINEKINKGIKILEKEDKKNMIKTLSYISKTNKNKKEMNILLVELLKNIKISFQEEKSTIKYEEFYFNGIPTPKDIEFKRIGLNDLEILWKIGDIQCIDKENLKFIIEYRKLNEKFNKIYEGNKNEYLIKNLIKNTNYEFRICCLYNGLTGLWSEIKNVKTKNSIDSIILKKSNREEEFSHIILEWIKHKELDLIYRGTKDGATAKEFHYKCDNIGPTICLFENEKGNIFGGYTSISWTSPPSGNEYKSDSFSFLFTLTNIYGTEPIKFVYSNNNENIRHNKDQGPSFGGNDADLSIYDNYINNSSYTAFPIIYKDSLGKGRSIFTGDFNNNNKCFKLKELEVFKVLN